MSLSRSNQPIKELFTGVHLVIISEAKMQEKLLVRFSDRQNKHFDKLYDFDSEFVKMCGDAGTITEASIFDDKRGLGKRLWIAIKEVWSDTETVNFYIFDTFPYVEGMNESPFVKEELFKEETHIHFVGNWADKKVDKKQILAEQRAMIAKVEAKEQAQENLDEM
jgi:hypothetical protein